MLFVTAPRTVSKTATPAAEVTRYHIGLLLLTNLVTDGKNKNAQARLAITINQVDIGITPVKQHMEQIKTVSRYAEVGIQKVSFFSLSYCNACFFIRLYEVSSEAVISSLSLTSSTRHISVIIVRSG